MNLGLILLGLSNLCGFVSILILFDLIKKLENRLEELEGAKKDE